jgi:hypothetical protein
MSSGLLVKVLFSFFNKVYFSKYRNTNTKAIYCILQKEFGENLLYE